MSSRRLLIFSSLVVLAFPAGASAAGDVPSVQTTATLVRPVVVHRDHSAASDALATVPARQPLSFSETVLPVLDTYTPPDGGASWDQVQFPERHYRSPTVGWIEQTFTLPSSTPWTIVVNPAKRTAELYNQGSRVGHWKVVVGKKSTPTPKGNFYVREIVPQSAVLTLGPDVLVTNAIGKGSEIGLGLSVALHGADRLGDPVGSARSHGCVRFKDTVIKSIANKVTPGTPILIR